MNWRERILIYDLTYLWGRAFQWSSEMYRSYSEKASYSTFILVVEKCKSARIPCK